MSEGRQKLSRRARQTLRIFLVSLALTWLVVSLPGFHNLESAAYDFRRTLWKAWAPAKTLDERIVLVSLSESTYRTGWNDERTLRLLRELEQRGAAHSVVFGAGTFSELDKVAEDIPKSVTIVDESKPLGQSLLFFESDSEQQAQLLDEDGVLRSIPRAHPSLKFAKQLLGYIGAEPRSVSGDRFHIDYLEAPQFALRGQGVGIELPLVATPAEALEAQLASSGEEFDLSGKLFLFERFRTVASRVGELNTPQTPLWPFQLYACLLQTYIDDTDVEVVPAWLWIPFLMLLMALNIVTLNGQAPIKIAIKGSVRFGLLFGLSVFLLPYGYDLPMAIILLGTFLSTLTLLLLEFRRLGAALRSFGGVEDAGHFSEERSASILFTEIPKYLLRLEREGKAELLVHRREYNVLVEQIASKYHGRVLDYQGDAQMIGFGLGESDGAEHAAEATAAALEIVEAVPQLSSSWDSREKLLLVHAGVCSGPVALGHVLAAGKQDLAAIGNTTNTAARIMGAAIKFEQPVLVSEATVEFAGDAVEAQFYRKVELKGKSELVSVYTVDSVSHSWKAINALLQKSYVPASGKLQYGPGRRAELRLALVLGILAFLALLFVRSLEVASIPEFKLYDALHSRFASTTADPRIIIVGIDEESVSEEHLGAFPWNRRVYADAVKNLSQTQYKGIFFDLLFRKPNSLDPSGDQSLVEAIESEPRVVVGGTFDQDSNLRVGPPKLLPGFEIESLNKDLQVGLIHRRDDEDRTLRSGLLAAGLEDTLFPSASVALLTERGESLNRRDDGLQFGSHFVKTPVSGPRPYEILIRFGPPGTSLEVQPTPGSYRYLSFWRLLERSDPILSELEGCYLLVGQVVKSGVSATVDLVDTPVGSIKGVEVHARTLDSILNGNHIRRLGDGATWLWMALVGLLAARVTAVTRSPKRYLPRVALICTLPLLVSCLSMSLGYWLEILFPVATVLVSMAVVSVSRYVLTLKAMGRFIPQEIAEELLRSHTIQDRRLTATVLLTDIRGYTTLSEDREALEMLNILNEYHRRTVACYERLGGQVLTYQGDAQIVVFGVFGKSKNPARDAVAAALELQKICAELRSEWGVESRDKFDVGAGLCTGEIEVGVLGGEQQRQVSVVGETVRKSHKVQALSEALNAPVILDEETYLACQDDVEVKSLGKVQPKGMASKIRLFKALSVKDMS